MKTVNELGVVERMIEQDGKLHVLRSQDTQAVLDHVKAMRDVAPSMFGDAKWRYIGEVPLVLAEKWSEECGAAIGSPEFAIYCKQKLMNGDYAALRVRSI